MKRLIAKLVPASTKQQLQSALIRRTARQRRTAVADRRPDRVLVLPPSTPGNVGDAAMILGLCRLLSPDDNTFRPVFIDYDRVGEWQEWLGGGSAGLLPDSPADFARWTPNLTGTAQLYVIGADVLDGKYNLRRSLSRLRLAAFAAEAGKPVTITGFSMRSDPPAAIKAEFRRLPESVRVCTRDRLSQDRLQNMLSRPVPLVADLAFMLQPKLTTPEEQQLTERLQAHRAAGARLIGLNLNRLAVRTEGWSDDQRAEWLVTCMQTIWTGLNQTFDHCVAVVIPHDRRYEWSDQRIGLQFAERAGLTDDNGVVLRDCITAPAVKALCAELETLITGRMHCGIAAIGQGVAPVIFDYQGKVEGMLNIFGLDSAVQSTPDPQAAADQALHFATEYLRNPERYRRQILDTLPDVYERSRLNLMEPVA